MICLDTDFLIALWRSRGDPDHPARRELARYPSEVLVVCVPVAGEFLEGAAFVSEERLRDAVRFLHFFEIAGLSLQTAVRYAHVVSDLRRRSDLSGVSKADLWIAAWALEHNARLASQNVRHFRNIPRLQLISY